MYPLGPIFDDCGLNVTVLSYLDNVDFGFLASRELMPDVDDLAAYLRENAWQPIDLWPAANAKLLRERGRVDSRRRVHLVERPDQIVPIVCGGLGSLHAIGLPSFGESTMQSKPVVRRA